MYKDDIKLLAEKEKELENHIQTVRIYSQDIGMEFGIEKCVIVIMRSRTRHVTERIELPNQEIMRTFGEKETYKYSKILEADNIKLAENIGSGQHQTSREYWKRTTSNKPRWLKKI